MKTTIIILAVISALLIVSTVICGLWIKNSGEADESSIKFHLQIGLTTLLFTLVTLTLSVVQIVRLM